MLSAGPIPHNSIHLLIIITDFVALTDLLDVVVFIITSFLAGVEFATSVCSTLSFTLFFWGHNEYKIVFSIYSLVVTRYSLLVRNLLVTQ